MMSERFGNLISSLELNWSIWIKELETQFAFIVAEAVETIRSFVGCGPCTGWAIVVVEFPSDSWDDSRKVRRFSIGELTRTPASKDGVP